MTIINNLILFRRITTVLILSLFHIFIVFSQPSQTAYHRNQLMPYKTPIPPGGIWLKDSLFIDQTEIANIHWLEYLYHIQKDSSEEFYLSMLPDTLVWYAPTITEDSTTRNYYIRNYFRSLSFHNYPVVGISYAQVQAYCHWRSEVVSNRVKNQVKGYETTFVFRLPTEAEWQEAASAGSDPIKNPYGFARTRMSIFYRKRYNQLLANCTSYAKDEYGPVYVNDNAPSDFWIFNMIDNVSEMVAERGITKGGNWFSKLTECAITKRQHYDRPSAVLGFRCICVVRMIKL